MAPRKFLVKLLVLLLLILLSACFPAQTISANNPLPIIPQPEKIERLAGEFHLAEDMEVSGAEGELQEYFISQLNELTGVKLTHGSMDKANVLLNISIGRMGDEAYRIYITKARILITAATKQGLFRGMQTFFQLVPVEAKAKRASSSLEIPCINIDDKPRFGYRGLTLDCARNFMSVKFIKRYIDIIAYYKFNALHWRLTDDQGWRIQIKKYSKLTEKGATQKLFADSLYSGYYTQEDIKEIVEYARKRYITIIPEIDMPGHVTASLAAYPKNACIEGVYEPAKSYGIFNASYCAGDEDTYDFIENIIDEVCELFPGKYIHIGGDDVNMNSWKTCKECQERIKEDSLKDTQGLYVYFLNRVSSYITKKGKTAIVWNATGQQGLLPDIMVQSLQDSLSAADAAKEGHGVINSPRAFTSMDLNMFMLDLNTAYSFEPVPEALKGKETEKVLGGEVSFWNEIFRPDDVDKRLFPRILALAETFWSPVEAKDYKKFEARLNASYPDIEALGIEWDNGNARPKTLVTEE